MLLLKLCWQISAANYIKKQRRRLCRLSTAMLRGTPCIRLREIWGKQLELEESNYENLNSQHTLEEDFDKVQQNIHKRIPGPPRVRPKRLIPGMKPCGLNCPTCPYIEPEQLYNPPIPVRRLRLMELSTVRPEM